jgi:hypothetical protein
MILKSEKFLVYEIDLKESKQSGKTTNKNP